MRRSGALATTLACLVVLALAACSGTPRSDRETDAAPGSPRATDEASGSTGPDEPDLQTLRNRCGFPTPGRTFEIPGPGQETRLVAAELGSGPDVAVLVHQDDATGLCGWVPYAEWASRHGVRALLVDACGYGESVCAEDVARDPAAWIGTVVDWARAHRAGRVTLVGASMGGSLAVGTGARIDVDAVVDLSGPVRWDDVPPLGRAAAALEVPLLASASTSDTGIDAGALRRAAAVAPEGSRYVPSPLGHGWSMVIEEGYSSSPEDTVATPLGRLVRDWVAGTA